MNASLVSIVIPCFNYGRFLGEAVDSALRQTHRNLEVLVIDDGSTDNTREVALRYGSELRYHCLPHQGPYSARNVALGLMRGDYFLNLDADNRLKPTFVAESLATLESCGDPQVAYVFTQRQTFGDEQSVSAFPAFDLAILKQRNYIDMCSLIRGDVARQVRFDPAFNSGCGDYDFFLTLAERGYRGLLLDKPLLLYRVHGASMSSEIRKRFQHRQIMRRLIRKHRALYSKAEARQAMCYARGRMRLALVNARRPDARLAQRLRHLGLMIGARAAARQLAAQAGYTLCPARFCRRPPSTS